MAKSTKLSIAFYERYLLIVEEAAVYFHKIVIPAMNAVRCDADALEELTDKSYWPFPTYSDLLYY